MPEDRKPADRSMAVRDVLTSFASDVNSSLKTAGELLTSLQHASGVLAALASIGLIAHLIEGLFQRANWLDYLSAVIFVLFVAISLWSRRQARIADNQQKVMEAAAKKASRTLELFPAHAARRTYNVITRPTHAETLAGLQILRDHFGSDAPTNDAFLASQAVNPTSIIITKDGSGAVVGIGDYHGLRREIFSKFKEGTIAESDFRAGDFLNTAELGLSNEIYLGGVSVRSDLVKTRYVNEIRQSTMAGIMTAVLAAFAESNSKSKGSAKIDAFALGHTTPGRNALSSLGFFKLGEMTLRRSSPIFGRTYTLAEIRHLRRPYGEGFDAIVH